MPQKYLARIPPDIRAKLIEYHQYQGDKDIKPVRAIWYTVNTSGTKYPAYLVRVTAAETDEKFSCIDQGEPYVTELVSRPTVCETEMIEEFLAERCFDDELVQEDE